MYRSITGRHLLRFRYAKLILRLFRTLVSYEMNNFFFFLMNWIGDARTNQIMGLTSLHTILLRQHNLIADALCAMNPHWSDERLFQESRKIVGALMQHITYNEFLPVLLGRPTMQAYGLLPQTTDYTTSYDPNVNPSITNEFSTAAYRMGHSLIQGNIQSVEHFPFIVFIIVLLLHIYHIMV